MITDNLRRLEGVSATAFAREPSAEILSRVLCGEGSLSAISVSLVSD
jgi:hypothetical protein